MRSPKETRLESAMKLLEQLNLTQDQLDDLEAYLSGEKAEEVLAGLPYKNLSLSQKRDSSVFNSLFKHGMMEEAGRLFNILFAIGGISCSSLLPQGIAGGSGLAYLWKLPVDQAKAGAVYAADISSYLFRMSRGITPFMKLMNYDADAIKQAFLLVDHPQNIKNIPNSSMHSCGSAKLVLLASYFLIKYPNAGELFPKEEKHASLLSGVGRFFGKAPEINRLVKQEDISLMQQYESILIQNIENIYEPHNMPASAIREIQQAIQQGQVNDNTLKLAQRKCKINNYSLNLLGSTALLNFTLSDVLRNFVKVCFAISLSEMFTVAAAITDGFWMDIRKKGGDYDEYFDIDSRSLILQAAARELSDVLKTQFRKNKSVFMDALEKANAHDSSVMMNVLQQEDKPLFLQQRKNGNKERDKLIDMIVDKNPVIGEVKKYLRGETEVSSLYPYENQIYSKFSYGSNLPQIKNLLESYAENYSDQSFYNRAIIYYFLKGATYFFYWVLLVNTNIDAQKTRSIYAAFNAEHLDMAHQLKFYSIMHQYFYNEKHKELLKQISIEVFGNYLTVNREEVLSAFREADALGRVLAVETLSKNADENKAEIFAFSQDSSKLVKDALYKVLSEQKDWDKEVLALLTSKKAAERELAVRVLAKWDAQAYQPEFTAALEKEKNGKVRTLLQDILNTDAGQSGSIVTLQDLVKTLHKGGKKRSLAWAYETPFSAVHKKRADTSVPGKNISDEQSDNHDINNKQIPDNSENRQNICEPVPADEEYLQAILLGYASMTTCGVNKDAAALAAELDEAELAVYVNELFDKWLATGAEAKKRWVLYAASIHGGTDIIKKLQHQINEWPKHSRGAIAADAVQALALNPKPEALLIVDSISRKFKFRQIKNAAGEALKFAADQLGITTEELADRIVPNLGFNENMERHFDYGDRKFTVTITPALEVEVFDDNGKKLKNFPAPGKKDDPEKAAENYAAFKEMKKQMKATVTSQKMRLELALSTQRQWTCEAWKKLFVENPIMHQFAIGLIWGVYEDKKLVQTFRYMEDGSFNTEDEEEFELPEKQNNIGKINKISKIGLVHPVELSEESIEAWKTQLEDYEITQPIEQLSRPVYHMTEEEAEEKSMERFGGCILNDLSLQGKMQNMGWYRGQAEDGGIFYFYYREDKEQGLRAEFNFSGSYVGGENEDVTMFDVKFNKKISELPKRYFSEIVMQAARATASSQERNKLWKDLK